MCYVPSTSQRPVPSAIYKCAPQHFLFIFFSVKSLHVTNSRLGFFVSCSIWNVSYATICTVIRPAASMHIPTGGMHATSCRKKKPSLMSPCLYTLKPRSKYSRGVRFFWPNTVNVFIPYFTKVTFNISLYLWLCAV
jgi:hypothetical protein